MNSIRMSPNSREVIGAISTVTSQQEYLKSTNGALNVIGSLSPSGTQDINITEVGGNAVTTTVPVSGSVQISSLVNPLVASPLVGQSKIASTSVAVRLNGGTSQPLTNGIIISAPSGNVSPISVGTSSVNNTADGTGNGYLLAAGGSISFAVTNTNDIYINGTSGDYVSWAGS